MSLIYPAPMPSSPSFASFKMRASHLVGMSESPYTKSQQLFEWPGKWWEFDGALPPMPRAAAEEWIAWGITCRGKFGTFPLGDPANLAPRGSALGSVNVTLPSGIATALMALSTWGWSANQSFILRKGDYVQVPRNYIVGAYAINTAPWTSTLSTVGKEPTTVANAVNGPDGALTADEVDFKITSGGQVSCWTQLVDAITPAGLTWKFRIWLKANSGTPSLTMRILSYPSLTVVTSITQVLSINWTLFEISGTVPSTSSDTGIYVSLQNDVSQAAKNVFTWGASLYSPTAGARLYKVLTDSSSNGSQVSTLDVFPPIREATTLIEGSPLIVNSPVGLFRLASNAFEWDEGTAQHYGINVNAIEAI